MEEKQKPKKPAPQSLFSYVTSTLFIFALLVVGYSLIANTERTTPEVVSLSEVARLAQNAEIKSILIEEQKLIVTKKDDVVVESKKEPQASLVEVLGAYGISAQQLSSVDISVKEPRGVGRLLLSLLPFLFPILLLVFFFWILTRSAKSSGGMQAFTFGQSKARVTDPSDEVNRVTFKDVAGAKEAKEDIESEITEVETQPEAAPAASVESASEPAKNGDGHGSKKRLFRGIRKG